MIVLSYVSAAALFIIVAVGLGGLLIMCMAIHRRIKLIEYLLDEHDQRLRTLELDAGITNWTSDLQE